MLWVSKCNMRRDAHYPYIQLCHTNSYEAYPSKTLPWPIQNQAILHNLVNSTPYYLFWYPYAREVGEGEGKPSFKKVLPMCDSSSVEVSHSQYNLWGIKSHYVLRELPFKGAFQSPVQISPAQELWDQIQIFLWYNKLDRLSQPLQFNPYLGLKRPIKISDKGVPERHALQDIPFGNHVVGYVVLSR